MPEQQDSPDLPDQPIGPESQLGEWFEKLEKPLMIYAYQTLSDREEAMDMVQEAFVRFFKEEEKVDVALSESRYKSRVFSICVPA